MKKKIKLVHIINYDKKFFDVILDSFEHDERFDNSPIVVVNEEKEIAVIGNIGHNAKVVVNGDNLRVLLSSLEYDAVFFFSLPDRFWNILNYIPKDKKVIWWAWGFDLYQLTNYSHAFIPIDILKKKTQSLFNGRNNFFKTIAVFYRNFFAERRKDSLRRRVLERIDYFQPVIKTEYELIKNKYPEFRAKEFYYPQESILIDHLDEQKPDNGNILFGNSANYSNNHLDVWDVISDKIDKDQRLIVPLNYGKLEYQEVIASKLKGENVHLLKEMMPRDEYFKLIESCSYLVIGVIRQQAMGNINRGLYTGVKVFLYKDSVAYKYFQDMGIKVFAIEDINENSFRQALSLEDANRNIELMKKEKIRRAKVLDDFFDTYRVNNSSI